MSIGWNWNDAANRTHHNVIEYNHVHHVMNGMLNDGGAIYTLGTSPGSVIRNNVFHDVWPYSAIGWGIYLDATTNQYLVENNIVYNILSGGLMDHNGGHENVIQNNIFAFSAQQMLWPCWATRPNTFRRNIVYLTQGQLFIPMAERRLQARRKAGESLGEWDFNCYYNPNEPDLRFFRHHFDQWQALGLDQHSSIVDPQFENPEGYDFRVKPTSPALVMGFKPIDTSAVGLYGDDEWVAEPAKFKHPVTKLPPPPAPPRALSVGDGFEKTPVGARPEEATVSGEGQGASIRVTDERAATGEHSLKLTDAPGLEQTWQPHMYYQPHLVSGVVRQSFDILLEPGVEMFTEWRDSTPYPECIGPSVTFYGDGRIVGSGKLLTTVPVDRWVRAVIECALGRRGPGTYSVEITPLGGEQQLFDDIPYSGDQFEELHWLGFVCNGEEAATCYVDNVRIAPAAD